MNLHFSIISDKNIWDEFVSISPQASPYSLSAFLDSMGTSYKLHGVWENDRLLLGAIILTKDEIPIVTPHPYTMYQGLVFSNSLDLLSTHSRINHQMELISYAIEELSKIYSTISFCLHHSISDIRCFDWFNYHQPANGRFSMEVKYTGILDLNNVVNFELDYVRKIRELRRRDVRKAKKLGYHIRLSDDISTLVKLYQMTFERQNFIVDNGKKVAIESMARSAIKHNFGYILVCEDQQKQIVSATLFLFDATTGYYAIGATNPKFRDAGVGSYLMLENIKHLFDRNIKIIDFVGMNSPQRGDYKASFNASPIPYYQVTWKKPGTNNE